MEWLRDNGFRIYGVVCDGMFGLLKTLSLRYPIQMCQFHQQMIVRRYLADNPELAASSDLLGLVNSITVMDKESFICAFNEWHEKYIDVLNERVQDRRLETPLFMRPRLRSAYLSIKRNMVVYGLSMITRTVLFRIQIMDLKASSLISNQK